MHMFTNLKFGERVFLLLPGKSEFPIKQKNETFEKVSLIQSMRKKGLEPSRLAAQEPKSCTSANSVISAYSRIQKEWRRTHLLFLMLCSRLGQLDSNQRMQESKSCALPLGDDPLIKYPADVYGVFTNKQGG